MFSTSNVVKETVTNASTAAAATPAASSDSIFQSADYYAENA